MLLVRKGRVDIFNMLWSAYNKYTKSLPSPVFLLINSTYSFISNLLKNSRKYQYYTKIDIGIFSVCYMHNMLNWKHSHRTKRLISFQFNNNFCSVISQFWKMYYSKYRQSQNIFSNSPLPDGHSEPLFSESEKKTKKKFHHTLQTCISLH